MSDHHDQDNHHSHSPSEQEIQERILLKLEEKLAPLMGGHHHHHCHPHHHVEYKAPKELTPALALFSIKKLSLLSHFPAKDQRALEPVAPGVLSWTFNLGFGALEGTYAFYVWRTLGYRGFLGKAGVVGLGLVGAHWAGKYVVDNLRELTGEWKRERLVKKYRSELGDEFLLRVLDPSFKLEHHAH